MQDLQQVVTTGIIITKIHQTTDYTKRYSRPILPEPGVYQGSSLASCCKQHYLCLGFSVPASALLAVRHCQQGKHNCTANRAAGNHAP